MTGPEAIEIVQRCVEEDRYEVRQHFYDRMNERSMFWPDVQGIVDTPEGSRTDGDDQYSRPRWFFKGTTTDKLEVEILIVFDKDENDFRLIFWTIYWGDSHG